MDLFSLLKLAFLACPVQWYIFCLSAKREGNSVVTSGQNERDPGTPKFVAGLPKLSHIPGADTGFPEGGG